MFASGNFGAFGPKGRPVRAKPLFTRRPSLGLSLAFALGLGLSLGACSTMSDIGEATTDGVSKAANAMNPANWFGDSKEDAAKDDEATQRAKQQRAVDNTATKTGVKSAARDDLAQRTAGNETQYPKLSSVPERPRNATSQKAVEARQQLREGLVADTANAQYTDSQLRAQTDGTPGARQTDSARSNERLAGEPPAAPAPTMPVTAAPVEALPQRPAPTQQMAAATPRVAPPPVAQPANRPSSYGARQAAAASAAPVAPVAPAPQAAPQPAPQRQAALAAPETAQAPSAAPRTVLKTVQVATIYFNSGSSKLSANDRRIVQQVADVARRTGGMLRIIGHSSMANAGRDAERAAMVNYKMSLERANAVANALLNDGIPGNQMQVMAEGAQNPIYAESSATGMAGNRRTEIYLDFYEAR